MLCCVTRTPETPRSARGSQSFRSNDSTGGDFWSDIFGMGCVAAKESEGTLSGLSYDTKGNPISAGADKYIFAGTFKNTQKVAVLVARRGGERRFNAEVDIYKKLGKHPNIIEMVCCGVDAEGMPLIALEAVEPIGYDMSRLINQYSWTGQVVPGSLMCSLIGQLISALNHMHGHKLIHQDLKTLNVLVDPKNQLKLIDMGIVAKVGDRGKLKAAYLAPEVCKYQIMTEKVDCWGVGLIIHQTYQKRATLLSVGGDVVMKRGMPSKEYDMPADIREAMCGLLEIDPNKRWSLEQTSKSTWFKEAKENFKGTVLATPMEKAEVSRKYIHKYKGASQTLGAFAAKIGSQQNNVVGKTLQDLGFGSKLGITVLLIKHSNNKFERVPGKSTAIRAGDWIYFGIQSDPMTEEDTIAPGLSAICEKIFGKNFDPKNQGRDTADAGQLVPFSLEFDSFTFPDRGAPEYVLGPEAGPNQVALDARRTLNLNISGVVKQSEDGTPLEIWFPQANQAIQAGDLGLVVRAPRDNGLSDPTVLDEDLEALMDVSKKLPQPKA